MAYLNLLGIPVKLYVQLYEFLRICKQLNLGPPVGLNNTINEHQKIMNPLTQADKEPFVIGGETLNYAVVVDGNKLEASIHKVIEAAEATVDAFPASVALD